MKHRNIIMVTGLALFAMFFGTGNIIFPLQLGVMSGDHLLYGLVGFIISGVGIPLLGMYAVSLGGGNYQEFFKPLGSKISFATISFIILVIGILVGAPRTAIVTHGTFSVILPNAISSPYLFNAAYFSIVFILIQKGDRLVTLIGKYISPVKIVSLMCLVLVSILYRSEVHRSTLDAHTLFNKGFDLGYGTMDLLGTFFFCTTAYQNLRNKAEQYNLRSKKDLHNILVKSCCLGGVLTLLCNCGLMLATYYHSTELTHIATEHLISALSLLVFGRFGTIFVCFLILIASIATACALAEVTTHYLHNTAFRGRLSRKACLISSLVVMYTMSILGFTRVMSIAMPILNLLYPALILYCFYIIYKTKFSGRRMMSSRFSMGTVTS